MASSSSSSTRRDLHSSSHHRSRDARLTDDDDDDGELPWWEQDRSNTAGGAGGAGRGFDSTASHRRRRDYDDRRLEHARGYYDRDAHYSGGGLPYDRDPAAAAPPSSYRDRDRHYDRDRDRHRPRRDLDNTRTSTMTTTPRERERAPDPQPPSRRLYADRGRGGDEDGFTPHAQRNVAHHPPPSSSASVPSFSSGTGGLNSRTDDSAAASNGVEEGEIPRSTQEDDMELSLDPVPEPDPEQILAERRRKRAEILAKYATASAANSTAPSSLDATPEPGSLYSVSGSKREGGSAAVGEEGGGAGTPGRPEVERAAKRLRIQETDSPAVAAASSPGLAATATAPTTAASTPGLSTRSGSLSVDPIAGAAAGAVTASSSSTAANLTATTPHANDFSLVKDAETSKEELTALPREDEADEISAADYNPDQGDDDRRRVHGQGHANASTGERKEEVKVESDDDEEEEEVEVEEDEEDDDEDDMFAIGTADDKPKKTKKVVKRKKKDQTNVPLVNRALPSAADSANPSLLADNYDDAEGYYRVILGEALDQNRYHVVAHLGKGMFSSVVRARDLGEKGEGRYEGEEGKGLGGKGVGEGERREVAIKIVRSQESMYKAGLKEAQILRKLRDADPDDKKHLVRLHRTFEHRGHLCLVFESLSMNLREVVKRYGKDVGLNLRAVRAYASQMFLALALMRKCEIMHADLKPDNILVNESKSTLKVSDLGSASDVTENEITPYLVSRFYRAPEIILGLPYDCSLDVWSIACTLYELYTGKILFPGRTNNHMLLLIMETKGKFNHKVIRKARFHDQHFDENMTFLYTEKNDTITPRAIPAKPSSDLRSRLMPPGVTRRLKEEEGRLLTNFVDLLEKMLSLEPARRPSPKELLNHPFIRG